MFITSIPSAKYHLKFDHPIFYVYFTPAPHPFFSYSYSLSTNDYIPVIYVKTKTGLTKFYCTDCIYKLLNRGCWVNY